MAARTQKLIHDTSNLHGSATMRPDLLSKICSPVERDSRLTPRSHIRPRAVSSAMCGNQNKVDMVPTIMVTPRTDAQYDPETESDVHSTSPTPDLRASPTIVVDALDLKPCLKPRKDIVSSERHVSVNICHEPAVSTPRARQRGRSNSLPVDILQNQLAQFSIMQKNKLPSLCEESKLSVEGSGNSVSNPDVSKTRRVSFVLPTDSDDSDSDATDEDSSNQKPRTVHQNFLTVPGACRRGMTLSGLELPTGSDAFRQAMLSDDENSSSTNITDSDSDKSLSDSTPVTQIKKREKHVKALSPRRGHRSQGHGAEVVDNRLLGRRDKKSDVNRRRDISPRTPRAEWSKVSVIR